MILNEVAPGLLRGGSEQVNWFVVEADDRLTVVDAGFPAHFEQLVQGLEERNRTLDDVDALVLTHAHGDHLGFAERLRSEAGVPVYVHADDESMALTGERPDSERPFEEYFSNPALQRFVEEMTAAGGMQTPQVTPVTTFTDGDVLDVPGRPVAVHTPGHSPGHCVLQFAGHGVLIAGDALCTLNVATGRTGPQIGAAAFNVSSDQALQSLDRLEALPEALLVFGHGEAWTDGTAQAVAAARQAGRQELACRVPPAACRLTPDERTQWVRCCRLPCSESPASGSADACSVGCARASAVQCEANASREETGGATGHDV